MNGNSGGYLVVGLVLIAAAIALYLLPAIIAGLNGHRQKTAILVLNLLLGWTLVGWVISLVWAFMKPDMHTPVAVNNTQPTAPPLAREPNQQAIELERFAKLRDTGVLTEEEFQFKKKAILGLI